MLDANVEESQIPHGHFETPPPLSPGPPSSPPSSGQGNPQLPKTQIGRTGQDFDESENCRGLETVYETQDGHLSRVEETQFIPLEPDTQGQDQDSLESRVSATQYQGLEIDTQAAETQEKECHSFPTTTLHISQSSKSRELSPTSKQVLQPTASLRHEPATVSPKRSDHISPLMISEAAEIPDHKGFKWGQAPEHKNLTYSRPSPNPTKKLTEQPQASCTTTTQPEVQVVNSSIASEILRPLSLVKALPYENRRIAIVNKEAHPPITTQRPRNDTPERSFRKEITPGSLHRIQMAFDGAASQSKILSSATTIDCESDKDSSAPSQCPTLLRLSIEPQALQGTKMGSHAQAPEQRAMPKPSAYRMQAPNTPHTKPAGKGFNRLNKWVKVPVPDVDHAPFGAQTHRNHAEVGRVSQDELLHQSRTRTVPSMDAIDKSANSDTPGAPTGDNHYNRFGTHDYSKTSLSRFEHEGENSLGQFDQLDINASASVKPPTLNNALPVESFVVPAQHSKAIASDPAKFQIPIASPCEASDRDQLVRGKENARIPRSIPSRAASKTPTDYRPSSVSSNTSMPLRPIPRSDLQPEGIHEQFVLSPRPGSGVQKPLKTQVPKTFPMRGTPSRKAQQQHERKSISEGHSAILMGCKAQKTGPKLLEKMIGNCEKFVEEYDLQMKYIESQEQEISKLSESHNESKRKIEGLEAEKKGLFEKLTKFGKFHAKYQEHMNKVVSSQKDLMDQAKLIRHASAKVREELRGDNEARLKELTCRLQAIEEERKQEVVSVNEQKDVLAQVSAAKQELEIKLHDVSAANELLNADLQRNLLALSREQHNSELLHKQLTGQTKAYKELAKRLEKIPSDALIEITKDGGKLAEILSSVTLTQSKLDQATIAVNTLKNQENPLPSFLKLIEDLTKSIVAKIQVSDNNSVSAQESFKKLVEDFKGGLNQLGADKEIQNGLNASISNLRELNATLTAEKNAREVDLQDARRQLKEVQQDSTTCKTQLALISEEVVNLRAVSKHDERVLARLQELEMTNSNLLDQLENANTDTAKAKADLTSIKEEYATATTQHHDLEVQLQTAQVCIGNLEEEKRLGEARYEIDIKEEVQRVAGLAEVAKNEMKKDFDTKMNNFKQSNLELRAQLKTTRETLAQVQGECGNSASNTEQIFAEVASFKEQIVQIATALKHLEVSKAGFENTEQKMTDDLGAMNRGLAEFEIHLGATRKAVSHDIDLILNGQTDLERGLQALSSCHEKYRQCQEENCSLQKKLGSAMKCINQMEISEKASDSWQGIASTKQTEFDLLNKFKALQMENERLERQSRDLQTQLATIITSKDSTLPQLLSPKLHPEHGNSYFHAQESLFVPNSNYASQQDGDRVRDDPKKDLQTLEEDLDPSNQKSESKSNARRTHSQQAALIPDTRQKSAPQALQNPTQETTITTVSRHETPSEFQAHAQGGVSGRPHTGRSSNVGTDDSFANGGSLLPSIGKLRLPPIRVNGSHNSAASVERAQDVLPRSQNTSNIQNPGTNYKMMHGALTLVNNQEPVRENQMKDQNSTLSTRKKLESCKYTSAQRYLVPESQHFDPADIQATMPVAQAHFDEVLEVYKAKKARRENLHNTKESHHRIILQPKSALKKPNPTPVSNLPISNEQGTKFSPLEGSTYFKTPASSSTTQNKAFELVTNKQQKQKVVFGARGLTSNSRSGNSVKFQETKFPGRVTSGNPTDASPLPRVSTISRKRSSEAGNTTDKTDNAKAPLKRIRVSLPRNAKPVIPDSQEV